jgi:hypothetical protein|tara:strand:+ start:669 stop:890 length:222 start_codon:yes stop_codon:yes gene_type:complete
MNLEEKIKEEIYEYVLKFGLNKDELKEIDTYVLDMLKDFKTIIDSQNNVLNDKTQLSQLKEIILQNLEESKIV